VGSGEWGNEEMGRWGEEGLRGRWGSVGSVGREN